MTNSFHADIYVAGLGLFEMRHVTAETLEMLKRVERIFHLTDQHAALCAINPNTEELDVLYSREGKNVYIFDELARYVVASAQQCSPVALVLDGNPMFFSDISWKIADLGKLKGLAVEALPAISCLDVLPTQLGFEPGNLGMQVFEATQLVLYQLAINPYLSTLILQPGEFGERTVIRPAKRRPGAFTPLVLHLQKFFPKDHPAIFIRSACSGHSPTLVFATEVSSIEADSEKVISGMTLYIPRVHIPSIDKNACEQLGMPELIKEVEECSP